MRVDHGWKALVHVYPINDTKQHTLENCWCNPTEDDEDAILVHHSEDRREAFETGERKPS